ncbi:hypothetical protein [Enterococcus termitis]|uniref:Uncharacterized protein n=1 Tax=Enterococcus termitis TaxID=332950 RepID=A0A1E5H0Z7_9ENTE|nr:hypothetical protein [Enterococcus termitis]OEG18668.1 hypothetical protein BCR25_15820 [Enterococcus termitis]
MNLFITGKLKQERKAKYTVVNCSNYGIDTWSPVLDKFRYNKDTIFDIDKNGEIILEEHIPLEIIEGIAPILFLTDEIYNVKNTANFFAISSLRRSLIVELNGNYDLNF